MTPIDPSTISRLYHVYLYLSVTRKFGVTRKVGRTSERDYATRHYLIVMATSEADATAKACDWVEHVSASSRAVSRAFGANASAVRLARTTDDKPNIHVLAGEFSNDVIEVK